MRKVIKNVCTGTLIVSILAIICGIGSIFSYFAFIGVIKVGLRTIVIVTSISIIGSCIVFVIGTVLYSIGDVANKNIGWYEKA